MDGNCFSGSIAHPGSQLMLNKELNWSLVFCFHLLLNGPGSGCMVRNRVFDWDLGGGEQLVV